MKHLFIFSLFAFCYLFLPGYSVYGALITEPIPPQYFPVVIDNADSTDGDDVTLYVDIYTLELMGYSGNPTALIIPSNPEGLGWNIRSIAYSAFDECTTLKKVVIQDGITAIDAQAFGGCPLETLLIPKSITEISPRMLYGEYRNPSTDFLTMYVYQDSVAQTFAHENDINFRYLSPEYSIVSAHMEYDDEMVNIRILDEIYPTAPGVMIVAAYDVDDRFLGIFHMGQRTIFNYNIRLNSDMFREAAYIKCLSWEASAPTIPLAKPAHIMVTQLE